MNPLFIKRSAGGDNDVWNVVLPLCAVWAAMAALAAGSRARAAGLAALAGIAVGLHAATWSGWIFTHLVLLAGLGVTVVLRALASARVGEWRRGDVFRTVAELSRPGLQYVSAALFGALHLFVAWLGLLVLLLPDRDWRRVMTRRPPRSVHPTRRGAALPTRIR